MQSIEKDRMKSGLGKPHNIILTNFSLVSKTPMAAVQATDKAAELDSSLLLTQSTAGHTLSWERRGCVVWLRGLNQDCCNFYQAFSEWQKYSTGSSSTVYEGIQQY